MDDMQTFERRVATEVVRGMGPSEPVDDAAIFTAITTTQSPKWRFLSMFSATRFVVAGAIVALFGGFLLASLPAPEQGQLVPAAPASTPEPVTAVVEAEPPPGASVEGGGTVFVPGVDTTDGVPAYKYNDLLWFVKDDHWCRIVIATEFGLDVTDESLAQCHAWIARSPWGRNNFGQERVLLPETWAIRIADRAGWSSASPAPSAPTDRRPTADR